MGFLDNVSSGFNRGVDAVNRGTRTAGLRRQISDIASQRQNLAAQLGASLYEETRNNPDFVAGREQLYAGIAALDEQRKQLDEAIAAIENEAAGAAVLRCHVCGTSVNASDMFCTGCGTRVADIRAANGINFTPSAAATAAADASATANAATVSSQPGGLTCPNCGKPVEEDDTFCIYCGTRLKTATDSVESEPADELTARPSEEPADDFAALTSEDAADSAGEALVSQPEEAPVEIPEEAKEELAEIEGAVDEPTVDEASEEDANLGESEGAEEAVAEDAIEYFEEDAGAESSTEVFDPVEVVSAEDESCEESATSDIEPVSDSDEAQRPAPATCKVCGAPLEPGYLFCGVCGSKVTSAAFEPDKTQLMEDPAPSIEEAKTRMLEELPPRIDEAQTQLLDTVAPSIDVAETTVLPTVAEVAQHVCPKCGAAVEEGDRFCMHCGSSLL